MFSLKDIAKGLMGMAGQTSKDPKNQGYAPEITHNPNMNTNIPYSAHSIEEANLGNRYTANPTSSEFLGIDPARFGYPEDKAQPQGLRVRQNYGMQGFGRGQEDDYSPRNALTGQSYNNQQVTQNGDFIQPLNNDYGVQTSIHGGLQQGGYQNQPSDLQQRLRQILGF